MGKMPTGIATEQKTSLVHVVDLARTAHLLNTRGQEEWGRSEGQQFQTGGGRFPRTPKVRWDKERVSGEQEYCFVNH